MQHRKPSLSIAACATILATGAAAQDLTPVDVGEMSKAEFEAAYLQSYEDQLDWTKTAFARIDAGFGQFIDAESPLSDAERAIPGCLYDAADSPAKKEQLGLQLAAVQYLGETVRSDSQTDYIDVAFGEMTGFQPGQEMASLMQACNVMAATRSRMSLSSEAWQVMQEGAIERGYIEP